MSLAQEPLVIRRGSFSLPFRYSCLHSHSCGVHGWVTPPLHTPHDAPLPVRTTAHSQAGVRIFEFERHGFGGVLEPRYIVGAGSLDQ